MSIEFNEKGKYFTNIITKLPVEAIIQTVMHRIEGQVYVRPESRMKDELDQNELFLAVTNARIYDSNGQLLYVSDFISINRTQIVWVIPRDDKLDKEPESHS